MQKHQYKTIVQETHIDLFGHVNNAAYLEMYEQARWDLIGRHGYGVDTIQKLMQGPVILEINIKYQKEIKAREEIIITVENLDYKGKIGRLRQQMIKADQSVASEAIITYGLFDLKARKLIEPTPEWKRAVGLADSIKE